MRSWLVTLLLLSFTATLLSAGTSANAATSHWSKLGLSRSGHTWTPNLERPLFGGHLKLVPGEQQVRSFYARNQSQDKAKLNVSLQITGDRHSLLDQQAFRLGVRRKGGQWHRATSVRGTHLHPIAIRSGEVVPISVRVVLAPGARNRTMNKHVSFRINVRLSQRHHQGEAMNSTIRSVTRALVSARGRAALSLGVVMTVGVTGTFAFFTDSVDITGATFTSANLDLQVDNGDSVATTTLGMSLMLPGYSSAQVLTVKNNGNVPLKYTLTGGLTGTDAAAYNTAGELKLTIRQGGTRAGSGNTFTCTGGTVVYAQAALTNTPSTALIATRRPAAGLAASATETLCFQVDFISTAGNSLINKTATATFSVLGTSDVS